MAFGSKQPPQDQLDETSAFIRSKHFPVQKILQQAEDIDFGIELADILEPSLLPVLPTETPILSDSFKLAHALNNLQEAPGHKNEVDLSALYPSEASDVEDAQQPDSEIDELESEHSLLQAVDAEIEALALVEDWIESPLQETPQKVQEAALNQNKLQTQALAYQFQNHTPSPSSGKIRTLSSDASDDPMGSVHAYRPETNTLPVTRSIGLTDFKLPSIRPLENNMVEEPEILLVQEAPLIDPLENEHLEQSDALNAFLDSSTQTSPILDVVAEFPDIHPGLAEDPLESQALSEPVSASLVLEEHPVEDLLMLDPLVSEPAVKEEVLSLEASPVLEAHPVEDLLMLDLLVSEPAVKEEALSLEASPVLEEHPVDDLPMLHPLVSELAVKEEVLSLEAFLKLSSPSSEPSPPENFPEANLIDHTVEALDEIEPFETVQHIDWDLTPSEEDPETNEEPLVSPLEYSAVPLRQTHEVFLDILYPSVDLETEQHSTPAVTSQTAEVSRTHEAPQQTARLIEAVFTQEEDALGPEVIESNIQDLINTLSSQSESLIPLDPHKPELTLDLETPFEIMLEPEETSPIEAASQPPISLDASMSAFQITEIHPASALLYEPEKHLASFNPNLVLESHLVETEDPLNSGTLAMPDTVLHQAEAMSPELPDYIYLSETLNSIPDDPELTDIIGLPQNLAWQTEHGPDLAQETPINLLVHLPLNPEKRSFDLQAPITLAPELQNIPLSALASYYQHPFIEDAIHIEDEPSSEIASPSFEFTELELPELCLAESQSDSAEPLILLREDFIQEDSLPPIQALPGEALFAQFEAVESILPEIEPKWPLSFSQAELDSAVTENSLPQHLLQEALTQLENRLESRFESILSQLQALSDRQPDPVQAPPPAEVNLEALATLHFEPLIDMSAEPLSETDDSLVEDPEKYGFSDFISPDSPDHLISFHVPEETIQPPLRSEPSSLAFYMEDDPLLPADAIEEPPGSQSFSPTAQPEALSSSEDVSPEYDEPLPLYGLDLADETRELVYKFKTRQVALPQPVTPEAPPQPEYSSILSPALMTEEGLEILAMAPVENEYQLILVKHDGLYALMLDDGEDDAMIIKRFDQNPLAHEAYFNVQSEVTLGHKTMYVVEVGTWQGVLSLQSDEAQLEIDHARYH
jgi:hypothetical protein